MADANVEAPHQPLRTPTWPPQTRARVLGLIQLPVCPRDPELLAVALSTEESQQPQPRPSLWAKIRTKLCHVVDVVRRLRALQSQTPPRRLEGLKTDLGVGVDAGMKRLEMSTRFLNGWL